MILGEAFIKSFSKPLQNLIDIQRRNIGEIWGNFLFPTVDFERDSKPQKPNSIQFIDIRKEPLWNFM